MGSNMDLNLTNIYPMFTELTVGPKIEGHHVLGLGANPNLISYLV